MRDLYQTRRKTLGFSRRDTRRVPFGPVGNEVCSGFRFLAAEQEHFSMSLIKRAYRSRCYPTSEQRQMCPDLWLLSVGVQSGPARQTTAYREAGQRLSYGDLSALLPVWKAQAETAWLAEVSSVPLRAAPAPSGPCLPQLLRGSDQVPHVQEEARTPGGHVYDLCFHLEGRTAHVAKVSEPLAMRWSRPLPEGAIPTTVTVTRDVAGRYFVSLLVEEALAALPPVPAASLAFTGAVDVVNALDRRKDGQPTVFCAG